MTAGAADEQVRIAHLTGAPGVAAAPRATSERRLVADLTGLAPGVRATAGAALFVLADLPWASAGVHAAARDAHA